MAHTISPRAYTRFVDAASTMADDKAVRLKAIGHGVAASKFEHLLVKVLDLFNPKGVSQREEKAITAFLNAAKARFGEDIGNASTQYLNAQQGGINQPLSARLVRVLDSQVNQQITENTRADDATITKALKLVDVGTPTDTTQLSLSSIIKNAYTELRSEAEQKGHTVPAGSLMPRDNDDDIALDNPAQPSFSVTTAIKNSLLSATAPSPNSIAHAQTLAESDALKIATVAAKTALTATVNTSLYDAFENKNALADALKSKIAAHPLTQLQPDLPLTIIQPYRAVWVTNRRIVDKLADLERAELARQPNIVTHQEMQNFRNTLIDQELKRQFAVITLSKDRLAERSGKPLPRTTTKRLA